MRAIALAVLLAVTAIITNGCASEQQERIQKAQRDSLHGAPRPISWDPFNSCN
jgi:hypothetical protein